MSKSGNSGWTAWPKDGLWFVSRLSLIRLDPYTSMQEASKTWLDEVEACRVLRNGKRMVNENSDLTDASRSLIATGHADETGMSSNHSATADGNWHELYEKLREIASAHMRREANGRLLQTTAVVHEAFLRLQNSSVSIADRCSFLGSASVAMRRVLIDSARARKAEKRGGDRKRVELADAFLAVDHNRVAFCDLDEALNELKSFDPEGATVLEMMIFGGMTGDEVAESMGVSPSTVDRRVRAAKAWLKRELTE